MKKMFMLLMAIMLCFALTACSEKVSIDFPFELSSIENVEMFRFIIPVHQLVRLQSQPFATTRCRR